MILYCPFHVCFDWYIRTPKELWKEHQEILLMPLLSLQVLKGSECSSFVHDLQVCACPNFEDDVIYFRALCWASYRKYDKYLTPGSEMAYVGIVLTYHKQSDLRH